MKHKIIISWSGGKDSTITLCECLQSDNFEVVGLLSIFTPDKNNELRIGMHMIDADIIRAQARQLGLPLHEIIYYNAEQYANAMAKFIQKIACGNVKYIAFGDLHRQDIRVMREDKLKNTQIRAIFPLWGFSSNQIIQNVAQSKIKAKIVNVDNRYIAESYLGSELTDIFHLSTVNFDICGENGEYHSLVYDCKYFSAPINFKTDNVISISENYVALPSKVL